ncbi:MULTISPECIES: beta-ketoacyl-ACP synthase III [Protofrankia]|uniref:Beta-ketoacyl-[acyl-carrier-protein] synthase III n=1 Tax=Protofrankia coriariae TaxID=1562887 RepID=A0ABR5F6G9_9ACTN|nr:MULTISPECIES: beta-ketoacyl-ACP synthase III [Protofrankia]KLL12268.1 3-oxoacyl-ACP synthase [Protofrankia coriariae]ONH37796.1 3-oxoacyl-ACP synthase [Protofrankia sp. BMG5.30]
MSGIIRKRTGPAGSRILGVGAYRPMAVVSNADICQRLDSTPEWIESRSGIRSRRFANAEESLGAMAATAAGKALASAGVEVADVGCILVATMSHVTQSPSVATDVAARLGAEKAAAFDISAACAGFCHALAIASDMVLAGSARHVLVIGAERMSDIIDPHDRSTAFLFGDGAGAIVVGPSETTGIGPVVWGSDPSARDAIAHDRSYLDWRDNPELPWPTMRMAGQRVFRWASWQMAPVARAALDEAGITANDLVAFVPHQANIRIINVLCRVLALPGTVTVARDIEVHGNTSGASIPLAMDDILASGQVPSGGLALLIGFGAGLVYAAQVVQLP